MRIIQGNSKQEIRNKKQEAVRANCKLKEWQTSKISIVNLYL